MSRQKAVFDFTAYPRFHTRDSQSIHMSFDVIIGSYSSSPPYFSRRHLCRRLKYYEVHGLSKPYARTQFLLLCGTQSEVLIPIISTTHYHVSDKIKENTGIVKLYLLCRCSLFLASIGWAKVTFAGFDKFVVGGRGDFICLFNMEQIYCF